MFVVGSGHYHTIAKQWHSEIALERKNTVSIKVICNRLVLTAHKRLISYFALFELNKRHKE